MAGFIATGDVLLISYGFSQKLAAILLLASVFPVVILLLYLLLGSANISLINLMLKIERKLLIREDSLAAMFLQDHLDSVARTDRAIEELSDEEVRRLNLSLSRAEMDSDAGAHSPLRRDYSASWDICFEPNRFRLPIYVILISSEIL